MKRSQEKVKRSECHFLRAKEVNQFPLLGLGAGSFGRGAEQLQSISIKRWVCDGWILLN